VLAKKVATLDLLSNGRFIFGIGAGWNAEEMENHGTVFETRYKLMRERVEAMKRIWTQEEPEFHGDFVNFDKIWSYPKPVQKPHPPIFFGGHTPASRRRVVNDYDGWMPTIMRTDEFLAGVAEIRRMARDKGRESIEVSMIGPRVGRSRLERYEEAGVDRVVLLLPSAEAAVVMRQLDEYTKLVGL
jgi:probable F420-dependent oxidoreductase